MFQLNAKAANALRKLSKTGRLNYASAQAFLRERLIAESLTHVGDGPRYVLTDAGRAALDEEKSRRSALAGHRK